MIEFITNIFSYHYAYPYMLLFPVLFLVLVYLLKNSKAALPHPNVAGFSSIPKSLRQRLRLPILATLASLFIISLSIAAARPQQITAVPAPNASRNLLLSLDISKSMSSRDFGADYGHVARIEAVKAVVKEFITSRPDDRIGLVAFGSRAFLQAPLTLDHSLVFQMVDMLRVGLAGDGTAIGDGLGVALRHVEKIAGESKAVILVTDGVSNAGQVSPLKAAQVAADLGIKVHTIGIGSEEGQAAIQLPGGISIGPQLSGAGFDEQTLKEMAQLTGGVYFNAHNLEGLKQVYAEIDRLERSEDVPHSFRRIEECFSSYALLALISYTLYLLLSRGIFLRIP